MKYFVNDKGSFIHNSTYNKFHSEAKDLQFETINYLNSQEFVINSDVLDLLLNE